ncbi:MAG TPA: formate dehydrogenase accessory sulfurtransferase FdhD [Gemmatimonadales bacterium]
MSEDAAVEETPVWLEVNRVPLVTWMCTPDLLEELALGWLYGEGYIGSVDDVRLRPCSTDLGFWATIPEPQFEAVRAEARRPVLASGCGAVATYLADVNAAPVTARPPARLPALDELRLLFKALFQQGQRYRETGGIHAAALTDGTDLLAHAEDIGRHNAVDKVIGTLVLNRRPIVGLGLMVTGRISAELAFKAARAGISWVATPSVPSTLALEIASRNRMVLVGRAVSGAPHIHQPPAGPSDRPSAS